MTSTLLNLIKQSFSRGAGQKKNRTRNSRKYAGSLLDHLEVRTLYTAAIASSVAAVRHIDFTPAVNAAPSTVGPSDTAGNSISTAENVGTVNGAARTFNDFVGSSDRDDYYAFHLTAQSNFTLSLSNLSADADVELLSVNGSRIAISEHGSTLSESIAATLASGDYYVHVYQYIGDTTYTLQVAAPSVNPSPVPPNPNVSIHTRNLGSLVELDIIGTSRNDSILVTQAGSTLTIRANGRITNLAINFSEIVIHGGSGNDSIRVGPSVQLSTRLYGDAGNDALVDATRGRATIVSIGGGSDTVQGNGGNTNFWVDNRDIVYASALELANGGVHRVASFYQPFTTNSASSSYIPLELNGQDLADPTDIGMTTRLADRSFWGRRPVAWDINQGQVGDCYFLATLAGMANNSPARLTSLAVDLGDGTYGVQFTRNGVQSVVRVDGDLPVSYSGELTAARTGSTGNIWAPIMEKAYAFFRTGQATYSSLNAGWMRDVMNDFHVANNTAYASANPNALFGAIVHALATGHAVTVGTNSYLSTYAPLVTSHAYTIVGAVRLYDGSILYTVRNPWGEDGVANNSNMSDGYVTISGYDLRYNCSLVTWAV